MQTNYGLTGTGQVVGIADTGLDTGNLGTIHPDFTNRVKATYALGRPGDWSDPDGHGTHTSGSILGDGSAYSNGLFHGTAYGAQLVMQSVMDAGGGLGGLPADLNDLFIQAYTNGARVHSDSWGSSLNGYYSIDCANADEFMWNHPDMLVVFSAGNEGRDGLDRWGYGSSSNGRAGHFQKHPDRRRCGEPAARRFRRILLVYLGNRLVEVLLPGAAHQQRSIFPPAPTAPTRAWRHSPAGARATTGGFKPDIVAPGTDIISCRSRAPGAGTGWGTGSGVLGNSASNYYVFMGGTSMSTPLTAGAAALARQYLMERRGFTNPCAALVKATLINGARSLTPGQYGTGAFREVPPAPRPNNVEGWGQVNLAESLYPRRGMHQYLF